MKKIILILLITFFVFNNAYTAQSGFSKKASGNPILIQEGKQKLWCPVCGMNLKMFYKTSHAVKLKNGEKRQYCSMRCLVVDYDSIKNDIDEILVIDAKTEKMIDAKTAHYVLESKAPATMSRISKYAFADINNAKEFQKKYGGKIVTFDQAFASAKKTIYSDIAMSFKKKDVKMYPIGKKIYEKKCQKIDPNKYEKINLLKADIKNKNLCGNLKEKQLQALALFLWEKKRIEKFEKEGMAHILNVNNKEKCPVCGMFVYKYPRWVAKLYSGKQHYSFDGVKDMMKFYFEPKKWGNYDIDKFDKIYVTDYYSQKAIDGKKAFYVVGSDVLGPMGNELIPFKSKDDAIVFMNDHNGKNIYTFNQITKEIVYKLDEIK
jgi:nitrous oxide reductase accessory protein NosL